MSYSSQIYQAYSLESVKKINKLVHVLLQAKYDYTAVLANLSKVDVAQDGVRKYFKRRIEDTQSDLQTLIKIQQQIDGRIEFPELSVPTKVQFESVLEILQDALVKEKLINKILLDLHSRLIQEVPQQPNLAAKVEEKLQIRDQQIEKIVEQILHLQQNQGPVGEFTVSKLLKKEYYSLQKLSVETQLKPKYLLPSSSYSSMQLKQRLVGYSDLTRLSSRRHLEQRRQERRLAQKPLSKRLLLNPQSEKSKFSKQFKKSQNISPIF